MNLIGLKIVIKYFNYLHDEQSRTMVVRSQLAEESDLWTTTSGTCAPSDII
jgi:hypothetical protein